MTWPAECALRLDPQDLGDPQRSGYLAGNHCQQGRQQVPGKHSPGRARGPPAERALYLERGPVEPDHDRLAQVRRRYLGIVTAAGPAGTDHLTGDGKIMPARQRHGNIGQLSAGNQGDGDVPVAQHRGPSGWR